jgi:hypothetical protein
LPAEYRIDGARISMDPLWTPNRAPFGSQVKQFQNGEILGQSCSEAIWRNLHPFVQDWCELQVERMVAF